MTRQGPLSFFRRLLRDVVLGVSILAAAGILILYSAENGKQVPFQWIKLTAFTPIIFWAVLKQFKEYWRRPTLWLAAAALLALHVGAFTLVLRSYPQWPVIWFLPVGLVEGWTFFLILHKLIVGDLR
jgi:hypothetical protein